MSVLAPQLPPEDAPPPPTGSPAPVSDPIIPPQSVTSISTSLNKGALPSTLMSSVNVPNIPPSVVIILSVDSLQSVISPGGSDIISGTVIRNSPTGFPGPAPRSLIGAGPGPPKVFNKAAPAAKNNVLYNRLMSPVEMSGTNVLSNLLTFSSLSAFIKPKSLGSSVSFKTVLVVPTTLISVPTKFTFLP